MMTNRKVILFIAMSLDGFIAKSNGDLSFLSLVEEKGQDYGYSEFIKNVDTVILGRKTYDKVLTFGIRFPHADKQTFVITRTKQPQRGNINFYTGGLSELTAKLKAEAGKNIFVDSGAEVVNEMIKQNLIDEYIISIIPVYLGEGVPLFKQGRPEAKLKLVSAKTFGRDWFSYTMYPIIRIHYPLLKIIFGIV